jgi:hypothetical protein
MTPTSAAPLQKVTNGAIAAAVSAIILALLKRYAFPDMTPDIELAVNIVVVAGVTGVASLAAGYMTRIKDGEITYKDMSRIAEDAKP